MDFLNQAYQNGLKQFAEAVSGQLFLSKTAGDIPNMIDQAFEWVRHFYVLGFQVSFSGEHTSKPPPGRLSSSKRIFCP